MSQPAGRAQPDLALRTEEIRQEPRLIRPGDLVEFRVPVHNFGSVAASRVTVDFAISELLLQQRETIDLEAGESVTVVFETRFSLQDFRRPLRPQITVDPEREIPEARRDNNRAVLLPLELEASSESLVGSLAARKQRARLLIAPGECFGFRFSGRETVCGGDADIELSVAPDGYTVLLRADALVALEGSSLEQVTRIPEVLAGTQLALEVGQLVAVRARGDETIVVRVAALRRSSALPAPGRGRPREIDAPVSRRFPGEPTELPMGGLGARVLPLVQVEFEWIGRR